MDKKYRIGIIGHTTQGNYGHGLDRVWADIPEAEVVGVADANPAGLALAAARLQTANGYADYRRMLDEQRPDVVAICPRWLDQHCDMVLAAAERGVRGIYLEKPLCRTLAEADRMVAACERHDVKLAQAFQTRYSPKLAVIEELLQSGKIGRVLEFRARGKEDHRGGGEDLWVLGVHLFNLIVHLGGNPQWCMASVRQEGRPIRTADVAPGNEGIGPLAGDEVHAVYGLASGAVASFDSTRRAGGNPSRFGLQIFGSQGILELYVGYLPEAFLLPDPGWSPGRTKKHWLPISSAGLDKPEPLTDGGLHAGNVLAVRDLLDAIAHNREPEANIYEALLSIEMVAAVFESQRQVRQVPIPLANRENPLAAL